eukprot:364631-Chlamydomonas_euryale.AAC.16
MLAAVKNAGAMQMQFKDEECTRDASCDEGFQIDGTVVLPVMKGAGLMARVMSPAVKGFGSMAC